MTKQQIKDFIKKKIFGQGNQVDIGTALPMILGEILDQPNISYGEAQQLTEEQKNLVRQNIGASNEDDVREIRTVIDTNERIVATALNDLNSRIEHLASLLEN